MTLVDGGSRGGGEGRRGGEGGGRRGGRRQEGGVTRKRLECRAGGRGGRWGAGKGGLQRMDTACGGCTVGYRIRQWGGEQREAGGGGGHAVRGRATHAPGAPCSGGGRPRAPPPAAWPAGAFLYRRAAGLHPKRWAPAARGGHSPPAASCPAARRPRGVTAARGRRERPARYAEGGGGEGRPAHAPPSPPPPSVADHSRLGKKEALGDAAAAAAARRPPTPPPHSLTPGLGTLRPSGPPTLPATPG